MMTSKKNLIADVERAINVCYTAPDNPDEGYPYATGYSRSCLQEVLKYLTEETNNDDF